MVKSDKIGRVSIDLPNNAHFVYSSVRKVGEFENGPKYSSANSQIWRLICFFSLRPYYRKLSQNTHPIKMSVQISDLVIGCTLFRISDGCHDFLLAYFLEGGKIPGVDLRWLFKVHLLNVVMKKWCCATDGRGGCASNRMWFVRGSNTPPWPIFPNLENQGGGEYPFVVTMFPIFGKGSQSTRNSTSHTKWGCFSCAMVLGSLSEDLFLQ